MLRNPVVLAVGCAVLTGCFFYASATNKEQPSFTKAGVKKIGPGKTTKEDILKWFGPPLAMARKGDEDKFMAPGTVREDTFPEAFAAKHTLTENDIIYYYRNVETTTAGLAVAGYTGYTFVGGQKPRSTTAKLWVLNRRSQRYRRGPLRERDAMSGVQKKVALGVWARAVPAALLIFSLQGCLALPLMSGVPLPKKTVNQLQAGKTTKAELLKWFGPPLSIATKGGTLNVDHGAQFSIGSMPGVTSRYERVQADTFFELFATRHPITDRDRVYYYQYVVSYKYTVFLLVYFNETADTRWDRLWVLVDEQTDLVKDYVFRKEVWWVGATQRSAPSHPHPQSEATMQTALSSNPRVASWYQGSR
jgi:hypothetical protein